MNCSGLFCLREVYMAIWGRQLLHPGHNIPLSVCFSTLHSWKYSSWLSINTLGLVALLMQQQCNGNWNPLPRLSLALALLHGQRNVRKKGSVCFLDFKCEPEWNGFNKSQRRKTVSRVCVNDYVTLDQRHFAVEGFRWNRKMKRGIMCY